MVAEGRCGFYGDQLQMLDSAKVTLVGEEFIVGQGGVLSDLLDVLANLTRSVTHDLWIDPLHVSTS